MITEADIKKHCQEQFGWKEKSKPDNVPTIHFHLPPPLTPEEIAKAVQQGRGPWQSLDAVIRESIEERRAKKIREKYEMTAIPQAEWEDSDL